MPEPEDIDPVQDAKHAAEAAVQTPPLRDLYQEWVKANDEWAEAGAELKLAQRACDIARQAAVALEQKIGAAALADVPREMGRARGGWVAMGGRLYYVDETGCEADGWRYEVRAVPVRKLAV